MTRQTKHKRVMRDRKHFKSQNIGKSYEVGEWKKVFKGDINNKLQASEIEHNNYVDTGRVIHLQQAGEKLFSVVENHMMLKYGKMYRSYQDLLKMVKNNASDLTLLTQAKSLHLFYYNSDLYADRYEMDLVYKSVLRQMKNRL
jgi:hypothetical protein